MSDITQSKPYSIIDRLDDAAIASAAPSQTELMRELRVKPKPGWTSRLPPGLAAFVTNAKGMAGVLILLSLVLFSVFAPMLSDYNPNRRVGPPHAVPS